MSAQTTSKAMIKVDPGRPERLEASGAGCSDASIARRERFQQHRQDPIMDDGAVKLAFFSDPDGNALYLCTPAQPL